MTKKGYANLTLALALVAALLALSAAAVSYVRHGELNWVLIAAGIFLLAFGLGARGTIAKTK